uniref:Immunoglobulin subtype domain-containing protein n=1 Tax=Oncorhynchus mykiss TaxID=8022 RepID=A0A8C7Q6Q0_ONCMY
ISDFFLDFVLCVSGLVSVLVSQCQTMEVRTGDTITLQCSNVTTAVGHTAWFKQVNGSEPVCISSMYSVASTPDLHNADCGLYMFVDLIKCNLIGHCNGTISLVGEDDDGTMYLLPLVVILDVVTTAVLLIVILILLANLHNQDPDALNYAALNFTSKKRKMEKRREKELDPHVVYAATR